ncbi:putative SOS response-associated peptidase YedK [Actinoalloteichus hoggarensis]|uniref:Abasic site processing protein n=1 Tax=Actinoalloteichus hoggarensis TaxID=1470176 RepID=A0A221W8Z1_9PSEU|nr:SOS response-associated peptidase [Actinoalloteichus hoggarensis]ASO22480.1 Putative SOS response-associated peptidase YedK [Actinoalloteichus hoggarensis]MBB5923096.1 putative SOS response-associated peptidase YedK [Actinoalloteichus hoggarensis]
MCGRYAITRDPARLAAEFDADDGTDGAYAGPDHNVTPTRMVPIIVERMPADGGAARRTVRLVRWGLVPPWAKDPSDGPPMINARAETITEKPAYRDAAARRRCLVPADGWYEWKPTAERKQPYFAAHEDGRTLAMAAVFSVWWRPPSEPGAEPAPLVTAAVVTTDAVGETADIHHRMPLVLPRDAWGDWLDPARTAVPELLAAPDPDLVAGIRVHPVSPAVNSMRNNGPELMERIELRESGPPPTLFDAP